MHFIFWFSAFLLLYVYWGYLQVLRILCIIKGLKYAPYPANHELPNVSILLTVHNEELLIRRRIENILGQNYPKEKLQIIVASDGSTDATDMIASEYGVTLIKCDRLGKSGAQNFAMPYATGDIILLTDAEARFEEGYIREITAPFAAPGVACVTAHLIFEKRIGSISESQGYYWNYELKLRAAESTLGILAVASGQAMAFRRELFKPLPVDAGDDCLIPLDMATWGKRTVHQSTARAVDVMENSPEAEFHSRVRMTARNWRGTWMKHVLLNPFEFPDYAFSLWSHKLLRWLSSFALVLFIFESIKLTFCLYIPAILALLLPLSGLLGWLRAKGKIQAEIPLVGLVYSFFVANVGFLFGLARAWFGSSITVYRSGQKSAN